MIFLFNTQKLVKILFTSKLQEARVLSMTQRNRISSCQWISCYWFGAIFASFPWGFCQEVQTDL